MFWKYLFVIKNIENGYFSKSTTLELYRAFLAHVLTLQEPRRFSFLEHKNCSRQLATAGT